MIRRKLIRPSLKKIMDDKLRERTKDEIKTPRYPESRPVNEEVLPPERTSREADYYQGLIKNKTCLKVLLKNGNVIEGNLEYYDKNFLRITRENQPNLFIYKTDIKYFYEAGGEKVEKS
jgi:sRNA-binding regulator protein Hfq